MPTITCPTADLAAFVADLAGTVAADRVTVELTTDDLDRLADQPDDYDGHFDGEHVWVGGTGYRVAGLISDTPLRGSWAAWLGPAADTITDDQLARLDAASTTIAARWPDPDLADDRQQALSAAAQVILGDTTLEVAAEEWHVARAKTHAAHTALTGALIASSTGARSGPGSEADLVGRSGASRLTVRKALGR